jgi:DNA-binding PadR family transcriptional regulator
MRSRKKANELTSSEPICKEATHYPLLYKPEPEGIVILEVEHIGNRMRKHYALSPTGKKSGEKEYDRTMGIQPNYANDPVA